MWHGRIKELFFMNQSSVGSQYQFQEHEKYCPNLHFFFPFRHRSNKSQEFLIMRLCKSGYQHL